MVIPSSTTFDVESYKLWAVNFLVSAALSCYNAFLLLFFQDRNLSYIQMGICFAAFPLIGVIFQPLWGYITDKYLNKKITLITLMTLSSTSILFLVFAHNYYTILAAIILFAMFMTSMTPILDALTLETSTEYSNIHFNSIKLMGSVGYSTCVAIMGIVIKHTNINMAFYTFVGMNLINIILVASIKYKDKANSRGTNPRHILNLLKDRRYAIFVISVLLLNITLESNRSYRGELIEKTGGDVSNPGLLWSVVTLFEVPPFSLETNSSKGIRI